MISIDAHSDPSPVILKSRGVVLRALALPLVLAAGCSAAIASSALPLAKGVFLPAALDCAVLANGTPDGAMVYSDGLLDVYTRMPGSPGNFFGLMIEKVEVTGQTYSLTLFPMDSPGYATSKTLSLTISDDKDFASSDGQQRFRWCAEKLGE